MIEEDQGFLSNAPLQIEIRHHQHNRYNQYNPITLYPPKKLTCNHLGRYFYPYPLLPLISIESISPPFQAFQAPPLPILQ